MRRRGLEPPPTKCGPGPQPLDSECQIRPDVRQREERAAIWTQWTEWTTWMLPRMFAAGGLAAQTAWHRRPNARFLRIAVASGRSARTLSRRPVKSSRLNQRRRLQAHAKGRAALPVGPDGRDAPRARPAEGRALDARRTGPLRARPQAARQLICGLPRPARRAGVCGGPTMRRPWMTGSPGSGASSAPASRAMAAAEASRWRRQRGPHVELTRHGDGLLPVVARTRSSSPPRCLRHGAPPRPDEVSSLTDEHRGRLGSSACARPRPAID
jgi:hypothetical protein